jgi:hypothetical protein
MEEGLELSKPTTDKQASKQKTSKIQKLIVSDQQKRGQWHQKILNRLLTAVAKEQAEPNNWFKI